MKSNAGSRPNPTYALRKGPTMLPLLAMAMVMTVAHTTAQASDIERLKQLLAITPEGGWVKASTATLSSAFPTGSVAVNIPGYDDPGLIVAAWSSVAWDSSRGNLMLWGGGHANYAGNEMYVWNGRTGDWARGSLPSKLNSDWSITDNSAPNSAHTYDNNLYLRNNDMFLTLGGAAYPFGGNFYTGVDRNYTRTGPWLWDPTKADPNKVGGSSGSGYDPASPGGMMWFDRQNTHTGNEGFSYIQGTTAYRNEGGKDVVYVTADSYSSGWPVLYRYSLGDVRNGGIDAWEVVGVNSYQSPTYQGTGTIDIDRNMYVRTAADSYGSSATDLLVWQLGNGVSVSQSIQLVDTDGAAFVITPNFGVDYDAANRRYYMWDGVDYGTVWTFAAEAEADGKLRSTWTARKLNSTSVDQPNGDFLTGVLGKWQYAADLGAFIALDDYSPASGDAAVWLYKPFSTLQPVPEPATVALWALGLSGLLGWRRKRQSDR